MTDRAFADTLLGQIRKAWGPGLLLWPSAGVVIEDANGRVLMVRRAYDRRWQFPAGFVDEGESLEQTARRECAEELGITVGALSCFGIISSPALTTMTYPNGDTVQNVGACFCTRTWTGEIRLADAENVEFGFFALDGLSPDVSPVARAVAERYAIFRSGGGFQVF